jgi:hypothetical protein
LPGWMTTPSVWLLRIILSICKPAE